MKKSVFKNRLAELLKLTSNYRGVVVDSSFSSIQIYSVSDLFTGIFINLIGNFCLTYNYDFVVMQINGRTCINIILS